MVILLIAINRFIIIVIESFYDQCSGDMPMALLPSKFEKLIFKLEKYMMNSNNTSIGLCIGL